MANQKPIFTEEEESEIISLLDEMIERCKDEGNEEHAELLSRLSNFFESKRKQQNRHYCYECGAKRNESEMKEYKRAAFGKMSWVCNNCGDSRFNNVVSRNNDQMQFKIQHRTRRRW